MYLVTSVAIPSPRQCTMSLQTSDSLRYEKGSVKEYIVHCLSFLSVSHQSDIYAHHLSHVAGLFSFLSQIQTSAVLDWCKQQTACEDSQR